jgi:hypothetical protein
MAYSRLTTRISQNIQIANILWKYGQVQLFRKPSNKLEQN